MIAEVRIVRLNREVMCMVNISHLNFSMPYHMVSNSLYINK